MFCVGSPPSLNKYLVGVVYTSKQTFPSSFLRRKEEVSLYLAHACFVWVVLLI